jgi:hypothetical protein
MTLLQLAENGNGPQPGRTLKQRQDLLVPKFGERIRPAAAMTPFPAAIRWETRVLLCPVAGAGGKARHGGSGLLRVFWTKAHVVPMLLVGDGTARHPILFLVVEDRTILTAVAANGTGKPASVWGEATSGLRPASASPHTSSTMSLTLQLRCRRACDYARRCT